MEAAEAGMDATITGGTAGQPAALPPLLADSFGSILVFSKRGHPLVVCFNMEKSDNIGRADILLHFS